MNIDMRWDKSPIVNPFSIEVLEMKAKTVTGSFLTQ